MKFNFWNKSSGETLPREARKMIAPSSAFKEKAKIRFLAAFDARFPLRARGRVPGYVFAFRIAASVTAAIAVVVGGVSVYADTTNVPADNPLYSLKRLSESVQLVFTRVEAKPELEAAFAMRRAGEIAELEERHPTSSLLPKLAEDLGQSVDDSIRGMEKEEAARAGDKDRMNKKKAPEPQEQQEKLQPEPEQLQFQAFSSLSATAPASTTISTNTVTSTEKQKSEKSAEKEKRLQAVCDALKSAFSVSSSLIRKEFSDRQGLRQRLDARCRGGDSDENENRDGRQSNDGAEIATSTATTAATTIATSSARENKDESNGDHRRDRGPLPPQEDFDTLLP